MRGAKPAIFPAEYAVDKEFEDAIIYYNGTQELIDIILGLAHKTLPLEKYKNRAAEISYEYTPQNLYSRLINIGVEAPTV